MSGPWEKFQSPQATPAKDGPRAKFQASAPSAQSTPSAPVNVPAVNAVLKVGDTWTDPETGEQKLIIEPSMNRKHEEWTLADVKSRMDTLAKGSPQLPQTHDLGPTTLSPSASTKELADAARDDEFTRKVIAAHPQERELTRQVIGQQRAADRTAVGTGTREAINTFGLGLPRFVMSALSDVPIADEHEIGKAADAAGRALHPRAAQDGRFLGVLGQAAATPARAVATPLRAAATGAILSGAQAAIDTRGDLKETAKEAIKGGMFGLVGGTVLGSPQPSSRSFILENAPTRDALKQFSEDSFQAARDNGVRYKPEVVSGVARNVTDTLRTEGFRPLNQPKTFNVLQELHGLNGTAPTIDDLESIGRAAQKVGADNAESMSAGYIRRAIDDIQDNARPEDIIARDPEAAAAAIRDGRANYTAAERSQKIADAIERAAATRGSVGDALSEEFKSLRFNQEALRGFSDDEIAAMDKVIHGTKVENFARFASKASPDHPLIAAGMTGLGLATLGKGTLAVPIVGALAKRFAEREALKNAELVDAMTRARTPAYPRIVDAQLANDPMRHLPPRSLALAQILMAQPSLTNER